MDFSQRKLVKSEWQTTEKKVAPSVAQFLHFMCKAYHSPDLVENDMVSISNHLKIAPTLDLLVYATFLKKRAGKYTVPDAKIPNLKKADAIRFENAAKKEIPKDIYEFVLADVADYFVKTPDMRSYYTLRYLAQLSVLDPNPYFMGYVRSLLAGYTPVIPELVLRAPEILEFNPYLKHRDLRLYHHQKQLFELMKRKESKLVLYAAPTGTGKTVSPIALCQTHKVIFMCAARHVALALARNCVAANVPYAMAFGAESAADVILHFSAVVEWTTVNGRKKPNNKNGSKVQLVITDVHSYTCAAMPYLLQYTPPENVILYFDEPTITMDQPGHPLHPVLHNIWQQNVVPNIVLSSATLPSLASLPATSASFSAKFGGEIHVIQTFDCTTTIQLTNSNQEVVLPHHHCATQAQLREVAAHLVRNRTILRYIDLAAAVHFLQRVQPNLPPDMRLAAYFTSMDITVADIKVYYLKALETMEGWETLAPEPRRRVFASSQYFTAKDAVTLTDGPTIVLCADVDARAAFLLETAEIPAQMMKEKTGNLAFNTKVVDEISGLTKDLEDANSEDANKEKKMADGRLSKKALEIEAKIAKLLATLRPIALPLTYIPNTQQHLARFGHTGKKAFASFLASEVVGRILATDASDLYKLLLMMGVGVFNVAAPAAYTEIMKELAADQLLYMVLAGPDYIYGTDYSFCHVVVSEDLAPTLTPNMLLQALGRGGRNIAGAAGVADAPNTGRLDGPFETLLYAPHEDVEAAVMNALLS
jgi:hypothetical protein